MKKILIIDDERDFAETVKQYFEESNTYEVVVEDNPERALSTAQKHNPDLILLDIIMPKMGGFEVLESLKKDDKTLAIPVIMMTVLDEEPPKIKATEDYAEDYTVKPVSMEALKKKIEEVLKRRRGR